MWQNFYCSLFTESSLKIPWILGTRSKLRYAMVLLDSMTLCNVAWLVVLYATWNDNSALTLGRMSMLVCSCPKVAGIWAMPWVFKPIAVHRTLNIPGTWLEQTRTVDEQVSPIPEESLWFSGSSAALPPFLQSKFTGQQIWLDRKSEDHGLVTLS